MNYFPSRATLYSLHVKQMILSTCKNYTFHHFTCDVSNSECLYQLIVLFKSMQKKRFHCTIFKIKIPTFIIFAIQIHEIFQLYDLHQYIHINLAREIIKIGELISHIFTATSAGFCIIGHYIYMCVWQERRW